MRRPRRVRRRHTDAGMTLLEIMIVLALIGLIAAAIGRTLFNAWTEGRLRTTKLQVREVVGAVQQSMLEDTTCPTLEELVNRQVLRDLPRDAWGTPLVLRCPSEHGKDPVDVISLGPDKKERTADDINSWSL
jgi:general secretion pathway protein G